MSAIYTTRATSRLSARLKKSGIDLWVAATSGDAWGKYLLFQVGGRCVGSAGFTLREAEEKVAGLIARQKVVG